MSSFTPGSDRHSDAAAQTLTEREREWLLKMPSWSSVRGVDVLAKFDRLEAENERLRTPGPVVEVKDDREEWPVVTESFDLWPGDFR